MQGDDNSPVAAKPKLSRTDNDVEDDESNSRKKIKSTVEESSTLQMECSVCMENHSDSNPVMDHQCRSCSRDAWKICADCNEKLLSRTCPFCRRDYAPVMLYAVPGLPFSRLKDLTLSVQERTVLLYKFGIVKTLIHRSNVAIWSPLSSMMCFSFPTESSNDSDAANSHFTACVPMNEDRIRSNEFRFDNKVWDEIESVVENDTTEDAEDEADEAEAVDEEGAMDGSAIDVADYEDAIDRSLPVDPPSRTSRESEPMGVNTVEGPSVDLPNTLTPTRQEPTAAEDSSPGPAHRGYMTSAAAFFWVLSFTRHPDHKLFTVMTAQEWTEALDPNSSSDTMETLQALRDIIAPPPS